jgi:hypothetical protein
MQFGDGNLSVPGSNEESLVINKSLVLAPDVVLFPVALTSPVFHQVQLLKLLHDNDAPKYAFQSSMEWGCNCTCDDYHFQPCPQCYESQIQTLTEPVGMQDCHPLTMHFCLKHDTCITSQLSYP